jgi:RNA polymerase sigma-70 factor (ECF subfamily)
MSNDTLEAKISFEKLFKLYYAPLFNYVNKNLRNREDSKEIVQDSLIKLWNKRDTVDLEGPTIKSYLFTTARNTLIDFVRSRKDTESMDKINAEAISDEKGEKAMDSLLIRSEIIKSLDKLKPKRKEIFILNKLEGYTYKEIAAHLEISERAVEDNMAKAFLHLKEDLKEKRALFF